MTKQVRRQIASVVALVVAAAATIATTPGPGPGDSTTETINVALSREQPYEFREVTITVEHGGHNPNSVWLSFFATPDVDPNQYWVAVIPQDDDQPVRPWFETMTYQYQYESFDLTEWCEHDCHRTYLVVLGLAADIESLKTDFEVTVSSAYDAPRSGPLVGVSTALHVSENQAGVLGTVDLRAAAAGRLEIAAGNQPVWRGSLHVSGAPQVKQGVGILEFQFAATLSDPKANAEVAVNIDGAYILVEHIYGEQLTDLVRIEWLEACQGKSDCDIPIELETGWDPFPESTDSVARIGSVTFDFTIDARLLYIGMDVAPAGASLELTTP